MTSTEDINQTENKKRFSPKLPQGKFYVITGAVVFAALVGGLLTTMTVLGVQFARTVPDRVENLIARFENDNPEGEVAGVNEKVNEDSSNETIEESNIDDNSLLSRDLINNFNAAVASGNAPLIENADTNNDGVVDLNEAPKPEEVDPELEAVVTELETLLSQSSLSVEDEKRIEELFDKLQTLHAQEYVN